MRTTSNDYGSNGRHDRDPEAIARAIDETRSEVDETLDALQARLSPGQILDRAMELMRETGGQFAGNLGRSVRDNPLPVILTGVGLTWMMAASRSSAPSASSARSRTDRAIERVSGTAEQLAGVTSGAVNTASGAVDAARDHIAGARDRIAGVAASVSESTSNAADKISDEVSAATSMVKDQSHRLSVGFSNLLREQPLLVGAVGIALGALLGYALPTSDTEDRLLGEASDATARQAVAATKEQLSKVSEAASDASNDASSAHRSGNT